MIYFTKKMPVTCVLTTKSFSKIKKIFHSSLYFSLLNGSNLNPLSTSLKPWKTDLIKKYKPK